MTGIESAIGYVYAWVLRQADPVTGPPDSAGDHALAAALDRLHELVDRMLGEDPAFRRLAEEAAAGRPQPSDRTRRRAQDALAEVAGQDPEFAAALDRAVAQVRALAQNSATGVDIHAAHGSVAAWSVRDVTLGNPPQPVPQQG
ncbi:hypothetical protein AB0K51_31950 [Kitasatospora sp. NPDC049285]|uniref:hypothetical protein n=1 Tax=Kitasatospora sp. NPDC049285 TaxID=3157096 RepID=UPI0034341267